jgi:hypothetical protein
MSILSYAPLGFQLGIIAFPHQFFHALEQPNGSEGIMFI